MTSLDTIREAGRKAAEEGKPRSRFLQMSITTGYGFRDATQQERAAWLAGYDEAKEKGE